MYVYTYTVELSVNVYLRVALIAVIKTVGEPVRQSVPVEKREYRERTPKLIAFIY